MWNALALLMALYLFRKFFFPTPPNPKKCGVVVLGDIGRSPRMLYHCQSLLDSGYSVVLFGLKESEIPLSLQQNPNLHLVFLLNVDHLLRNVSLPAFIRLCVKACLQAVDLCFKLCHFSFSFLLIQNPPAIPTIPVCAAYCTVFSSKMVIDWHNYAFSLMKLTVKSKIVLRIAFSIEFAFGQMACLNFSVSNALKKDLESRQIENVVVFPDCPSEIFQPISEEERFSFLTDFSAKNPQIKLLPKYLQNDLNEKCFLLVSSTSWTVDEDFTIVLNALKNYDTLSREHFKHNQTYLPSLMLLITGKGPMKDFYLKKIERYGYSERIEIHCVWLSFQEYSLLLASADIGICIHQSSSGLDLPMKIVDMFGCGLPVLAYSYNCISELVQNDVNGITFKDYEELTQCLLRLFCEDDFLTKLKVMKIRMEMDRPKRWKETWNSIVNPALLKLIGSNV